MLSGGVGLVTNTTGGNTTYIPVLEPLAVVPLGERLTIESRASLLAFFTPGANGYDHSHFAALTYLQGDYLVNQHLTVVGGSYLLPFGTYNERLTPIWIGNFQDEPLMEPLGLMNGGAGLGGQLRGSLVSRPRYSFDYAGWFSARSGNSQFKADRSTGVRGSFYFPERRLEVGGSYGRLLQGQQENFAGAHLWWESQNAGFRLRSEFARGEHAYGYWFEADWRPFAQGNVESPAGRLEPVVRMQQTLRINNLASDGLPSVNTQRADFGIDYNLPHNTRILSSYSRQFSAAGNTNIWETGIVYRFLFPVWKGRL
ncbi:MAG TPA: hypothetical protein VHX60_06515 [Acidobacteriaceae bacterium]|nr:hypothetical protein [Acidobacteriaceae bacterium]